MIYLAFPLELMYSLWTFNKIQVKQHTTNYIILIYTVFQSCNFNVRCMKMIFAVPFARKCIFDKFSLGNDYSCYDRFKSNEYQSNDSVLFAGNHLVIMNHRLSKS